MAKRERTYNIPIRKEFRNAPLHKRADRAVTAVQDFLKRHMKSDEVKLGQGLNQKIWERGMRNPPHHVKVTAIKDENGLVTAELFGEVYNEPTREELEKAYEQKLEKAKPKKSKVKEEKPKSKDTDAKKLEDDLVKDMTKIASGKPAEKKVASAPKTAEPKSDVKKTAVKKAPSKKAEEKPAEKKASAKKTVQKKAPVKTAAKPSLKK